MRERIAQSGPLSYCEVVDLALYDPEHGFYSTGGRAGRRGDFLTSPEVGPLFGAMVANALDQEWDRLGQPAEFTVVDAGAGPGTLARTVAKAAPRCTSSLRYVCVERSAAQRAAHPDGVESVADLPAHISSGVIIANELLDNLAFSPVDWNGNLLVTTNVVTLENGLVVEPSNEPVQSGAFGASARSGVDQSEAAEWMSNALSCLERGSVLVLDYARKSSADVEIRTYSEHGRAGDPLVGLGTKDITVDLDLDQLGRRLRPPDLLETQASWLHHLEIDRAVEDGRRSWEAGAAAGDLAALWGRSRIREAEALLEPNGLGGFMVATWLVG